MPAPPPAIAVKEKAPRARLIMKSPLSRLVAAGLLFAAPLLAQEPPPPPAAPAISPGELDQALGPIALYPDALIALILPATTDPSDVVLAARYLQDGGDPADTDDQPWDDSLKALTHYPDVVRWMDQNLAWTKQVGEAFLEQPDAVMNSIQHLRTQARAAGALNDTPQQQVVMDGDNISIMPAQPDVIYVPAYDPDVVYASRPESDADSYLTFGVGYPTGFWLGYDLDWGHRRIWTVDPRDREQYWRDHRDWRHPAFPGRPDYLRDPNRHPWKPPANYPQPPRPSTNRPDTPHPQVQRPTPFPTGSTHPADPRRSAPDRQPGSRDQDPAPNRPPENQSPSSSQPGPRPAPVRPVTPEPERNPKDPAPNRGRESRDAPHPPAAAPARQPPPPARPPAPPPAKDDSDDKKK
jgi:hypothetical protein